MTDPIQEAINKTLGTPAVATPEERLEEAVSLLRKAKEQRQRDMETIADLQGDVAHYDRVNRSLEQERDSANHKLRYLKDEVNQLRRVPAWIRALFRA